MAAGSCGINENIVQDRRQLDEDLKANEAKEADADMANANARGPKQRARVETGMYTAIMCDAVWTNGRPRKGIYAICDAMFDKCGEDTDTIHI